MSTIRDAFATLKLLVIYVTLGPLVGIVGIPWTLLTKDITWLYWASMWVTRAGIRGSGIKVRHVGFENIPVGRACIFMCNHVSNLDPPVLVPAIPTRCSVLLKKELMGAVHKAIAAALPESMKPLGPPQTKRPD